MDRSLKYRVKRQIRYIRNHKVGFTILVTLLAAMFSHAGVHVNTVMTGLAVTFLATMIMEDTCRRSFKVKGEEIY